MCNEKLWRKLIYWLRKNFLADLPIFVRTKNKLTFFPDDDGICIRYNTKIVIEINKNQSFFLKIEAILHEWAHAITLTDTTIEEHNNEWGKAYSRIYREFLVWNWGIVKI
jgi:hypothetical protein